MHWVKNLYNNSLVGPRVTRGLFAAGSSQAITKGQLLERTGDSNTEWVPIDSDHDATSTKLAIAACDIASGDLAGYYPIWEFRPGDVWVADLATASGLVPEDALYYSSATAVTTTGSNIIAYSVNDAPNSPAMQKFGSKCQLGDSGTTFADTKKVWLCFREAVSSISLQQRA